MIPANSSSRPNAYVLHQKEARRLFLAPPMAKASGSVVEVRSLAASLAAIGMLLCLTGVLLSVLQVAHNEAQTLDAQARAVSYSPLVLNLPEP